MESMSDNLAVNPPWEVDAFFTEEGLRAAQEYFFQTHATNSRLIAEGRNAQGVGKTFVRRKLSRELGDDFKMYTGSTIGEGGDGDVSKGIRGELNDLLISIYRRIAPNQPITSPTQEDLTILSHPHGGLEVCYAMVFYYEDLLRKYASVASNRRLVLRAIMDEELFKWVWRMAIAYMLSPPKAKLTIDDFHLSAGLNVIPREKQKVPLGQKVYEIGMFLLGKTMQESKLRPPLCLYFVTYLRQLQSQLVIASTRQQVELTFQGIAKRLEGETIEHPLVAVDALMNGKGASMNSFDDVLKDERYISQMLPAKEGDFINQFEDFGNPKRLAATLRKLVPDPRKEIDGNQDMALMPLLLMLRTMPITIQEVVLSRMPVPILNMVKNRIINTAVDDVGKELVDRIMHFMDARRAKGETYAISGRSANQKGAVSSSIPPAKPKQANVPPGSVDLGGGETVSSRKPGAAVDAAIAEAKSKEAKSAEAASRPSESLGLVDEKALISFQVDEGKVRAVSISARDLMELAGKELRLLLPFVVFSLRTGQIFGLESDQIKRETVEKLMKNLHAQGDVSTEALLPRDQVVTLLKAGKGIPMGKLLLSVVEAHGAGPYSAAPPDLAPIMGGLEKKFGIRLHEFLAEPGNPAFKDLRASLDADEKEVLGILQRVARAQ